MKFFLFMLAIVIGGLLFTNPAMPADQSSGNANRWGITTKEPVEDEEDVKDKIEEIDIDTQNKRNDSHQDKEKPGRKEDQGDAVAVDKDVTGPKNQTHENKSVEKKSAEERPSDTLAPGKTKDIVEKEPGEKSNKPKKTEALIKWKNEAQKTQCNTYLTSLKESFLKARYYSIQGVPCGTAENARSFMTLIDNCKRDCPDGFLKKHGYTSRIIRNLSWLEKLGSERCPDMNISLPQTHTDEHRHQDKKGDKAAQQKKP